MHLAKFITFEGGEGSGKSTQTRLLAERLGVRGLDVLVTREPGGSPFAERVRALILDPATPPHSALSEALLFYAARADHLERTIRPALCAGRWVVCDRFSDSTRVYQGHAGTLDGKTLAALEAIAVGAAKPDLTVIVDIPVAEGLARASQRRTGAVDPYEARTLAFHEKLREGFLKIAAAEPGRCVLIDGSLPEDDVARRVWAAVETRLLPGGH